MCRRWRAPRHALPAAAAGLALLFLLLALTGLAYLAAGRFLTPPQPTIPPTSERSS